MIPPFVFSIFQTFVTWLRENHDYRNVSWEMICIYNYADDNTVSNCDNDIDVVIKTLENDSMELINWFSLNLMKANPDKFQAIAIGKKNEKSKFIF